MIQVAVSDNSMLDGSEISRMPLLVEKIADKNLSSLQSQGLLVFPDRLSEADDLSPDQMVLFQKGASYWTSNIVGLVGVGRERLTITSRFDRSGNNYFFQYLMSQVFDIPNIFDLNIDGNKNQGFFDLLLFMFPYYLKSSLRKGVYKTYQRNKYNDSRFKGQLDIARHISKNVPFVGNVAYSQRELNYDNFLTELIRHTIELIKRNPQKRFILEPVKDQVSQIIEATSGYAAHDRHQIIEENVNNPVRHAYYHEYSQLQRICLLLLKGEKQNTGSGPEKIHGVLFDVAWLWEEYINILISDFFYHPMNKNGTGAHYLFTACGDSRATGRIFPDFIGRFENNRIIADAKYKPIKNIKSDDYLQVLAYMYRFDSKHGCYFYPETSIEAVDGKLFLNAGTKFENNISVRDNIFIEKIGLQVPREADSYSSFVEQIQVSEANFVERMSSCFDVF